jgi:hypothetical protein
MVAPRRKGTLRTVQVRVCPQLKNSPEAEHAAFEREVVAGAVALQAFEAR